MNALPARSRCLWILALALFSGLALAAASGPPEAPGDAQALTLWLEDELPGASPGEALRMAEEAVSRMEPSPAAAFLCEKLEWMGNGALLETAADCYRRLLDADLPSDTRQRLLGGSARAFAKLGDREGLDRALAALPPAERPRAVMTVAFGLVNKGRCEERVRLLSGLVGYREETSNVPGDMARALADCADDAAARELYLRIAAAAEPDNLHNVIASWKGKISPESLEAMLLERLRRQPGSEPLLRHLDAVYESAGWTGKRIAHLQSWIARQPEYQGDKRYEDLIGLLLEENRPGDAAAVLEGALARGGAGSWRLNERLAALYFASGRPEKVGEIAGRFLASGSEAERPLGHLLLGRAAFAQGRLAEASAHYRDFFAASPGHDHGATEEYLALLWETGDAAQAVRFLEDRHEILVRAKSAPEDRDEFLAERLAEAGFAEPALSALDRALTRAPERAALYERLGKLAQETGDWGRAEAAYRSLARLDPRQESPWHSLALLHVRRKDDARALATLEEGYRVLGTRPAALRVLEGRLRLAAGDPTGAIRVLREVRDKKPDSGEVYELLQEAYRALALEPGK